MPIQFPASTGDCSPATRREFLSRLGAGCAGIALVDLLAREVSAVPGRGGDTPRAPHFAPKAKRVIWFFMAGGVSHLESFDPKPALNQYAGKNIAETPFGDVVNSPLISKNLTMGLGRKLMQQIYPLQIGFQKYGQSGLEISDWWPHLGGCADELALVRSMWTTDNNHQAQYQFLSGRSFIEGNAPSIGAWVHYGLGTLNENLPQFILLGNPVGNCCGGNWGHGADYLGPQHAAVRINTEGSNPIPYLTPELPIPVEVQRSELCLLKEMAAIAGQAYPDDSAAEARLRSYELAFRMQTAVPEVMSLAGETEATRKMYGLDRLDGKEGRFARHCLLARRLAEAGVRFVQVMHGTGGAGSWDAHAELKSTYGKLCDQTDQPIAGLLKDLKQRGLLEETLVVFSTEFGRTPGLEIEATAGSTNREGRDHHPYGFSVWLAGGGIKGGVAHGATDELGFHAVEHRHYVTDVHATVLHQLGLIPERLDVPGRQRLEKDHGHPIHEIIS